MSPEFFWLKPKGRLSLTDPVTEDPMPESQQSDERLRAHCRSGSLPLKKSVDVLTEVGFGTVEIRAKRP